MNNRQKLRKIMTDHDIKGPDVARLLNREVATVHVWLCKNRQQVPDAMLELLEYKLKEELSA